MATATSFCTPLAQAALSPNFAVGPGTEFKHVQANSMKRTKHHETRFTEKL